MSKWKEIKRNNEIVGAEIRVGVFKLSVHHYFNRGKRWFASCNIFDRVELKSTKLSEARCQAKAMLQVKLQDAIDEIVKGEK